MPFGPDTTIIHGNNGNGIVIESDSSIEGFNFIGTEIPTGQGLLGSAINSNGTNVIIKHNVFDGNDSDTYALIFARDSTIEGNIFRNNNCTPQINAGGLVRGYGSTLVQNNVFENNRCKAVNISGETSKFPVVINNTIVGNFVGIYQGNHNDFSTNVTYRNNIVFNNGIGLYLDGSSGTGGDDFYMPILENNLIAGNSTDYEEVGNQSGRNGNIIGNPLFADYESGNYELLIGSSAIDSGTMIGAPVSDFYGVGRPLDGDGDSNSIIDIGAFEAPRL